MTVALRLVLDQLVAPTSPALAEASRELAVALAATSPAGCVVDGLVPSPGIPETDAVELADVHRLGLARRELAASWQLGIVPGVGKGMIHSPTLLAPLVRHDRVNETHQVVATLWDLRAWEAPDTLSRSEVIWTRAMLKRAEKHADAVVVPTHAMASRLGEIGRFGRRVRVIAGAAASGFRVPNDHVGRLRALDLPSAFIAVAGGRAASDGLAHAFRAVVDSGADGDVVVLDCPPGEEPSVADIAASSGLSEGRVHVRGSLDTWDRAAVLSAATVFVAPSARMDWPWRVVEALALGVPIVAADSAVHREVLVDAGLLPAPESMGDALAEASGAASDRLRVLSTDRAQAFSWREAAERVWALHADL
ncbi:glycosyltransferase [Microbacterium sp. P07]|uniref:glycosyltransferase n=1 Tax=Microbacterium sp. P07 TaxID=3366952 RepID=UPI00374665B6